MHPTGNERPTNRSIDRLYCIVLFPMENHYGIVQSGSCSASSLSVNFLPLSYSFDRAGVERAEAGTCCCYLLPSVVVFVFYFVGLGLEDDHAVRSFVFAGSPGNVWPSKARDGTVL